MEGIEHRTVEVNGIKMHIAEKGEGPVVLFIHGFPELWYSWRHQIVSLASLGYKAVAPDMRGYGGTDAPTDFHSYTSLHIVGDLVALIDSLGVDQVFVVAHDWGAFMAWHLCLFRPERVKALVTLGIHYIKRNPTLKNLDLFRSLFGDDYYMCRFQEHDIEAEFARVGPKAIITKLFGGPEPPIMPKETGLGISPGARDPLPIWYSKEDVDYVASNFEKSGFTGGLNYYRAFDLTWELTAPWTTSGVKVPTKYIVGDMDLVYNIPGVKEYVHGGSFKKDVPLLEEVVIIQGAAHFIQQERPDEISKHIYDFIKQF